MGTQKPSPMYTLALVALVALVSASFLDAPVLDDELIARINADDSIPWTAGRNSFWEGKTRRDARRHLGTILGLHPNSTKYPVVSKATASYPSSFDSRQTWSQCNIPIRNQEQCGSCWTFGAAEEFSWRRCISNLTPYDMATQYIVSCDNGGYGCQGGYINQVQEWLTTTGTTTQSCLSYKSGSGTAPPCPSSCDDGSSITLYKQASGSVKQFSTIDAIRQEVSTNGPVEAGFSVYSDFFNYKGGVYVRTPGSTLDGGHAVIIIGYGHDSASGLDYWLCSNSWGPSWGLNGYFKIANGQCGIESQVYAGCPEGGSACSR